MADTSIQTLEAARAVMTGPLPDIARRLSRTVIDWCPHIALIIYTRECTGRPRKVAGRAEIIERATLNELDEIKNAVELGDRFTGTVTLAGTERRVWAVRDTSDTLLLLVMGDGMIDGERADRLSALFGIVATSIRQQVAQASPDYLAESRAASMERARTLAELTATHEATLHAILGALRSKHLDDARARATAAETASSALVGLRAVGESYRALAEEDMSAAFTRLREEIGPMLRDRDVELLYVGPLTNRSPLPGEIAHAARAIVRTIVLAFAAQPALKRLRVAWNRDPSGLLIDVRDQESAPLDRDALSRRLAGRIGALHGSLLIEGLSGWGNRVAVTLPLDPPAARPTENPVARLNRRELEVLQHLSAGKRNKTIADELGVTENTVKFHVTKVLKKLDAATRGEAAAIGRRAGIGAGTQ
ncbi:response regulator transcription factor [Nocardia sp. R16R-3T]